MGSERDAPVRYRSDKPEGPTAGTETVDPLEFLARVTAHIPDKHQVMTRYSGWYANRVRGRRRAGAAATTGVAVAPRERVPLREAQRWNTLVGRAPPAHLRGGPAHLPRVRRADAHRGVHY